MGMIDGDALGLKQRSPDSHDRGPPYVRVLHRHRKRSGNRSPDHAEDPLEPTAYHDGALDPANISQGHHPKGKYPPGRRSWTNQNIMPVACQRKTGAIARSRTTAPILRDTGEYYHEPPFYCVARRSLTVSIEGRQEVLRKTGGFCPGYGARSKGPSGSSEAVRADRSSLASTPSAVRPR